MEIFLCERGESISYRDGTIFRKYYKYAGEAEAKEEGTHSRIAFEHGIYTPRFLGTGFSKSKNMFFNEFEFCDMREIMASEVNTTLLEKLSYILSGFSSISMDTKPYNQTYVKNLAGCLQYLDDHVCEEVIKKIKKLEETEHRCFIHGDFSLENIKINKNTNQLMVYDFQSAGVGTKNWDLAYLLGSIDKNTAIKYEGYKDCLEFIKIVTAVKYARGLRKKFQIEERKGNFDFWWNQ